VYKAELIDHRAEWDEIVKNVQLLSKKEGNSVEIGVFGDQSIVKIAVENEFGDPPRAGRPWPIPERSFLRHVFDTNKNALSTMMEGMVSDILIGKEKIERDLEKLGSLFEKRVKDFILSDYYKISKPNHPITIRIKGHDQTLVQVGKLFSVITHKITGRPVKIKI